MSRRDGIFSLTHDKIPPPFDQRSNTKGCTKLLLPKLRAVMMELPGFVSDTGTTSKWASISKDKTQTVLKELMLQ